MDLWASVDSTTQTLQARARARRCALIADKNGPARGVFADPVGVRQIAGNLIGNALDAARSQVRVLVEDTWLIVSDDGPGVPPDVARRIFDPFFSTKPPERGTGLGLAIARRLVEESGARLEWDTSAAGTEFRVCFAPLRAIAS
jgi:two-component system C4-dicarboxylate transport sensor histidine kinase DctB